MLDILGVIAFAVVFAFWWAFKPRWSRTTLGGDPSLGRDPLLTPRRSHTAEPARARPQADRPQADRQDHAVRTDLAGFRSDIEGLRAVA